MQGKVYTKTGDKGETSLFGGTRVPKFHQRLETYGTLDELNSHLGLIKDSVNDPVVEEFLYGVQCKIFSICTVLANEKQENTPQGVIKEKDIEAIEHVIDEYLARLPDLTNFILPGGHVVSSYCHVARTVCRRAERCMVKLSTEVPIETGLIVYINRLSDYLFVLARKILKDFNKNEILWKRDLEKFNK